MDEPRPTADLEALGPFSKDLVAIIQAVIDEWLDGPVHNGTIYSSELTGLIVEALLRKHPVALYNAGYAAGFAAARPADGEAVKPLPFVYGHEDYCDGRHTPGECPYPPFARPADGEEGLRAAAQRFLDAHPCASDGNLCRDQAALRAALAAKPSPEP